MSRAFPKAKFDTKLFDSLVPNYKPPALTTKRVAGARIAVRGKPLIISAGMQARFTDRVMAAVRHMTSEVELQIEHLFKSQEMNAHIKQLNMEETGEDASVGSMARMLSNAFQRQFDRLFGSLSITLAADMVADANKNSQQQTQASIAQINLQNVGQTLSLNPALMDAATQEILKVSVARAVNFIKSIPEQYLNKVNDALLQSIQNGNGLADFKPFLEKQGSQIHNWAHNTAMDQTRKTFNSLNAGRMKAVGVKRGEWIHSHGSQHPRPLHEAFDGKPFSLTDGAPVGDDGDNVMPGEEPNCRCTFTPILDDLFAENEENY